MSVLRRTEPRLFYLSAISLRNFITGKVIIPIVKHHPVLTTLSSLLLALALSFAWITAGSAQGESGYIRALRSMSTDETGQLYPAGLAFSPRANAFYVLDAQPQDRSLQAVTGISKMDSVAGKLGSARVAAQIQRPVNFVFDAKAQRLLILQAASNSLVEVPEGANGELEPQKVKRSDISRFGLQDPQGLSVDPASGRLFILDAAGPRLVWVDPAAGGSLDKGTISSVRLSAPGLEGARSLAFDPSSGNLHVLAGTSLYEITQAGALVTSRDLAEFGLVEPQGMVFAPSGDLTDDPELLSLYLADPGTRSASRQILSGSGAEFVQTTGQIWEFTFSPPVAPAAATFTSSLVRTTDMSAFTPPSPDPSGLTHIPSNNRLVMVDGEVEETVGGVTHFQGANLWEMTLAGSVLRSANISKRSQTVVPMTDEPTGVAWNPGNGHFYFTDDGQKEVFDLDPGQDQLVGTADDTWTHFDTLGVGNSDPEGIAFGNNRLFVSDGVNREIYIYNLNGSLDTHFDVLTFGIEDPESVEFNPVSGTLYIMSSKRSTPVMVETTTSGALIQTINFSAAGSRKAAGLAYAPASNGSGAMRFYIVDRGIDNNSNPNIIDGKMYEITAPGSGTPPVDPPTANPDSAVTDEDTAILINVASNDYDPNNNLNLASTNTTCPTCSTPTNGSLTNHGNGTFTYTPNLNFNGLNSFVYQICNTTGGCDTATVSITVNAVPDPPVANDDSATAQVDTPVTIDVVANDNDPDNDLDFTSINLTCVGCANPTNGTAIPNADGTITYSPAPSYTGPDSFVYQICDSTSACDTATVSITVSSAPTDLIFADGFESGNLSAWTSSVTDVGDLSVSTAAALVGSNGLQAVLDDNVSIYLTDDTPNAEPRYRARFYFDPNLIAMANRENHFIFYGYSGASTLVFRMQFRINSGNYQLRVALRNDASTWTSSGWFNIGDSPHSLEIDWRAASSAGANNGGLTFWIDRTQMVNLTGIDNDTRRIDRVRLGAIKGVDSGTRGTYFFDAFESRRQNYIGP